jgi:hypothetical protein
VTDRLQETAEAERLARLAAEFGDDDAVALCTAGIVLAYVVGNLAQNRRNGIRVGSRNRRCSSNCPLNAALFLTRFGDGASAGRREG